MRKNRYLMYAIAFLQGMVIYATISTLYREQRGLSLSDYAGLFAVSSAFFTKNWGSAVLLRCSAC